MSVLTFDNVWKIYDGDVVAVRESSFESKKGEFLALLGPSGCGKSTTMRMIAGLEDVTKGSIKFDGKTVNDWKPADRNVALSFESYALYTTLNVLGNIEFPLRARGLSNSDIADRVAKIAKVFEIEDLMDRMPSELSGGQAQRVSLARALVRDPDVLLLDEPLSHLDYQLRTTVRMRIRHLHDVLGSTTIYVTHDQEEAVALADRIIVMNHAIIQQVGDVDTLWNHPVNEFVAGFLGDPAMNFVRGDCTGGKITTQAGVFDISSKATGKIPDEVTVGFRPEHCVLKASKTKTKGALSGSILLNEFQGERCVVTVKTDAGMFKVVDTSDSPWESGDAVTLTPDVTKMHLFDVATGDAIQWRK